MQRVYDPHFLAKGLKPVRLMPRVLRYVAFLQVLLSDMKRFSGFPRHSDGTVIVDTHPDYVPPCTDENISDNKC